LFQLVEAALRITAQFLNRVAIALGGLPLHFAKRAIERDLRSQYALNIVQASINYNLIRDGQRPKGWALDRDPFLLETHVPGIFAVGDVRHGSIKRVASGVGEGSVAVQFIHQYLSKV
jgi:NADPH-dependent glutamate synthase beta subunit-like oxidoreductase